MTIRNATVEDLPEILGLVKELAQYERSEDQVTVSISDYAKGFAAGDFEALVAENSAGAIVGTAIYYLTWSTWRGRMLYLEDFVVKQQLRRMGTGQQLFDATLQRARDLDCHLIKWQVLDWNTPALEFYKKNNAIIETGWWNGKIMLK